MNNRPIVRISDTGTHQWNNDLLWKVVQSELDNGATQKEIYASHFKKIPNCNETKFLTKVREGLRSGNIHENKKGTTILMFRRL